MTCNFLTKSDTEVVFKRQTSTFSFLALFIVGLLIAAFGLFVPFDTTAWIVRKIFLLVIGLGTMGVGYYLPNFQKRFSAQTIKFDLKSQLIAFEMADGSASQIPLNQIAGFEIAVEKRSPSAANSAGVHYLHHHVNLNRTNGGVWTITSTTNQQEAEQTCVFLNRTFRQESKTMATCCFKPPKNIQVESGQPLEIKWQSSRYRLTIGNEKLTYSEFKSGESEVVKEFLIVGFSQVVYTYSAFVQNKNFSVFIYFNQGDQSKLTLHLSDLNPVECLQLETWLHQEISARKNLLA